MVAWGCQGLPPPATKRGQGLAKLASPPRYADKQSGSLGNLSATLKKPDAESRNRRPYIRATTTRDPVSVIRTPLGSVPNPSYSRSAGRNAGA